MYAALLYQSDTALTNPMYKTDHALTNQQITAVCCLSIQTHLSGQTLANVYTYMF